MAIKLNAIGMEKHKESNVLKIDLDIKRKDKAIKHLIERLQYLINIGLLHKKDLKSIYLIKKKSFSAKIYLNKTFRTPYLVILFQSILGDDYRRTSITLRDYQLNLNCYNRLFDYKKYSDGSIVNAIKYNITNIILTELKGS